MAVATGTSDGVRTDLGDLAGQLPTPARQLLLGTAQLAALAAPVALVVVLVAQRRWRRLATVSVAAALGAALAVLVTAVLSDPAAVEGRLDADGWLLPSRFPTAAYVAGAVAVLTVSKPWLSRRWRHAADLAGLMFATATVAAGTIGGPEAVLAVAAGGVAGAAVLVAVGAPNRRPSPGSIAAALAAAGLAVGDIEVVRAAGGRAMLVRATTGGGPLFLKVYGEDSRDADFLYRTYRTLVLRDGGGRRSARPLDQVEHQALLLVLCERAGVRCPEVRAVVGLPDGSAALVCGEVDGRPLDDVLAEAPSEPGGGRRRDELLDGAWRGLAAMHAAGLGTGRPGPATCSSAGTNPPWSSSSTSAPRPRPPTRGPRRSIGPSCCARWRRSSARTRRWPRPSGYWRPRISPPPRPTCSRWRSRPPPAPACRRRRCGRCATGSPPPPATSPSRSSGSCGCAPERSS